VLPCKVDYFNDKPWADGARLARSAACRSAWIVDACRPRQKIVCRNHWPRGAMIYNIFITIFLDFQQEFYVPETFER
jgi:hypothetical protein